VRKSYSLQSILQMRDVRLLLHHDVAVLVIELLRRGVE
jgi:hypothetical protein